MYFFIVSELVILFVPRPFILHFFLNIFQWLQLSSFTIRKREQKEVRDGVEKHQQSIPAIRLIQTFRFNLSSLEEASWWHETHLCKHKWETVLWKHFTYLYRFNKHHPFYHFPEILHTVTHFNILTAIIIMLLVTTAGRKKMQLIPSKCDAVLGNGNSEKDPEVLVGNCGPRAQSKDKNVCCNSCLYEKWSLSQEHESWNLSKISEHLVQFLCWHRRNYTDLRRDRKRI